MDFLCNAQYTFKVLSVHCALYKDHVKILPV